ncbi:cytokine-like nuclear factor N-PAC isoform X2 [Macrosteles quadrilineatus]|uniref:cytokine-like nuclear factor N-PAC isoform X2 n=1 Tax=Macrosteles quadrilineatus TaxID=74068 RepID=UPI0023E26A76|nr:cytokine-like nuclear factor N-PAC isoform X2 [Macrosteles quadrilineatus]
MPDVYKIGDLVWAKMKGFPPWPGRVSNPPKDLKRPASKKASHCIYFFGSENYGWIEESNLKPYEQYKEALIRANKSNAFKDAVEAIEKCAQNKGDETNKEDSDSVFDRLIDSDNEKKTKPKSHKKTLTSGYPIIDLSAHPQRPPFYPLTMEDLYCRTTTLELFRREKTVQMERVDYNDSDDEKENAGKIIVKREYGSSGGSAAKRIKKDKKEDLEVTTNGDDHLASSFSPLRKGPGSNLLDRPANVTRPETPPLDLESVSQTLKEKNILPSTLKFGFLGLGIMGSGIVKNLLNSGHSVIVWNRTPDKCRDFVKAGAEEGLTPGDVVQAADITFSCVADPQAAKDMVFGNCGVLPEAGPSKGYVEMTGIDAETSQDIAEAITGKGGRYLEAQVQGSKTQAEEGTLVILAAGDRSLFDECQSCFEAMGKNSFYLGEVGNASKMNLVLQLMAGVTLAGLAEGMALADRAGLQQKDVLEVMELTSLACPTILDKGKAIIDASFPTHLPLQHLQKDLKLSLSLGDQLEQPLPLTASANEVFKHAKRLGYGEHDASAVYIRARF